MIIQLGSLFGSLIGNIGGALSGIIRQVAPAALDIGQQFLQREINRKSTTGQRRVIQGAAVQALNTPGISVARLGGTVQPVGGRVQRATFTPAAFTPAQSPIGNIPLLPVGLSGTGRFNQPLGATFPLNPFDFRQPVQDLVRAVAGPNLPVLTGPRGLAVGRAAGAAGEPTFARDQFGNTIMFVPSPRPGEGFITLLGARQLGLSPTRPFWRFNRLEGQFEKIKPRRLNPFNFRAAARAGRRIERTLDAVKELVRIERKMTSGKVRLKKRKKK